MNKETSKKIGLWNVVGLGVGGAVGSGIFITLGTAIASTGRSILPMTVICVFYMLLAYWYNLALSGYASSTYFNRLRRLDECDLGIRIYRICFRTDKLS